MNQQTLPHRQVHPTFAKHAVVSFGQKSKGSFPSMQ